jgi:polysaccharide biosynthesis protein PslH
VRILFLAQRVPYPPNRGDKIPTYHYVRHLAQKHEVTVACLADGQNDLANADGLRSLVHAVDAVTLSISRARLRAVSALAGCRPLTVAYFDEPELRDRVEQRIKGGQVDAAVVFSSGMAQFVEAFDDLPRIIQFADLDSQKWLQYGAMSRPPRSWVYRSEWKRLLRYERHIAGTFTHSLVCAPRESDDFRRLIPEAEVECLPNGVDLDYFQPQPDVDRVPNSLVFTGVMNYRPNIDGVTWFCRDVLPRIREQVPDVTFTICGSSPDRSVRALTNEPGVTVTGAVDDVRRYLAKSTVAVVPLRIARGIQNKLLEAMAMGLPTVATQAARAGIDAQAGRDLLVADDATEFAAAVVKLLSDHTTRQMISRSGRAAVEAGYRWDHTLNRLDDIVTSVANHHQNGVLV